MKNPYSRLRRSIATLVLLAACALPADGWAVSKVPVKPSAMQTLRMRILPHRVTFDENTMQMMLVNQRRRKDLNHIYEFENDPLGKRIPVILIPGRAEEFQHNAWWKGLHRISQEDSDFNRRFKLYIYIYDSKAELDKQSDDFAHDLRLHFTRLPKNQPMMLVTYSLGGVIAREAFKDASLLERVDTILAIAVPFHGSPIFDPDWFKQYMRPPNRSPIRKFWDHLIYKTYMFNKTNLTRGLKWDNFDHSKPQFNGRNTPVKGDMAVSTIEPFRDYPNADAMKKKMVIYASYLENGYTKSNQPFNPLRLPKYVLEKSVDFPRELIANILPFYGFTVHSVFTYMNHQLANLPTYTPENPEGKQTLLYRFNDGAIPLSSMLFLSPRETPYTDDLYGLIGQCNARNVRIFVNLDHMHIGEYSTIGTNLVKGDIIHPEDPKLRPSKWILYDLIQRARSEEFRHLYRDPVVSETQTLVLEPEENARSAIPSSR